MGACGAPKVFETSKGKFIPEPDWHTSNKYSTQGLNSTDRRGGVQPQNEANRNFPSKCGSTEPATQRELPRATASKHTAWPSPINYSEEYHGGQKPAVHIGHTKTEHMLMHPKDKYRMQKRTFLPAALEPSKSEWLGVDSVADAVVRVSHSA